MKYEYRYLKNGHEFGMNDFSTSGFVVLYLVFSIEIWYNYVRGDDADAYCSL